MRYGTAVPVAAGATGRVVRCFDHARGEEVALKLLHRDDPDWVRRMLREAEVQMRLSHPHICPVYGTGELDGQPFITMRYVRGEPLDVAAARLPDRDKVALLAQVADALVHAHAAGVVHRDLKPSNLLVEPRAAGPGHVFVVDFGLVRDQSAEALTRTGELLGTPGYMAPEQATAAASVDARADIYSLGVVLYELLAGRRPFSGESAAEVLVQTLRSVPPSLQSLRRDIDPALARIVHQCLEREPHWRYADAAALRDDLQAFVDGRAVRARRDGRWRRLRRFARRHPWRAGLGAAAALLALAVLATGVFSVLYARQQSAAAQRYMEFSSGIEHAMRLEYMKPAHDVESARATLGREVRRFAATLPPRGPAAMRTGQLAVGRAHMALGNLDGALAHLEAALRNGEDSRALHAALGELRMRQYFEALQGTATLDDPSLRQGAVQEIDRLHRSRAREHLLAAASGADDTTARLMRALLSHLDGRSAEAEAALETLAGELAWPVDALILAGDLAATEALRMALDGDSSGAAQRFRQADGRYARAMDVARSHPGAATARCRTGGALVMVVRHGGQVPEAEWRAALSACDAAVALDSRSADAQASKALAYADLGLLRRREGNWKTQDFEPALAAGRAALRLDPGSVTAMRALGALLTQWSLWQAERGDAAAIGTAAEAIALLEAAVAREPASVHGAMMLSNGYFAAARAAVLGAADGERWLLAAEDVLERAAADGMAPLVVELHIVGNKTWRGYEAYVSGRDPGSALEDAVARARSLAARAPDHPQVHPALGLAAWTLADYQRLGGRPAADMAALALDAYRRVLADQDASFANIFNAVGALQLLARERVEQGAPIASELALLEAWLARLASRAGDNGIDIQLAGTEHLRALALARHGGDPRPAFDAARAALRKPLARSIDAREAQVLFAELAAAEHAWRRRSGEHDHALARADRAVLLQGLERFGDHAALRAATAAALLALDQGDTATPRRLLAEALQQMPALAGSHAGLAERLGLATAPR